MGSTRVILVEDEPVAAELYRRGLEVRGLAVVVCADATTLFSQLDVALPDVLVLDWNLPRMNGGEILDRLRLDNRTKELPVYILSNWPGNGYAMERTSRAGVLDWLEKIKTTPADLAAKVKDALPRGAARTPD